MKNFFERQRSMHRQTWVLGFIFILAFLIIILFTSLWSSVLFESRMSDTVPIATIVVLVITIAATLYRALSLMQGGAKVAAQLGATPLPETISDLQLKRLRNVVEEIAIASSTPVPSIFVLNNEMGINAFASGYSPADAAITVTRGALNTLNRDELQSVIAHEFSHITNGDMRLNIQLVGALFGISAIGTVGYTILRMRVRGKNAGGIILFGLGLVAIGFIGLLASRIIKASINRRREYLADACAVQYTRQNTGLAGALKKIAGVQAGSTITNQDASEFSHMFFCQGFAFSNLLATHPPVMERIRLLDPNFQLDELEKMRAQWFNNPPDGAAEDIALGFTDTPKVSTPATIAVSPAAIAAHVGTSHAANYQQAKQIIIDIPEPLRQAARNYYSVMPLLFGLIYSNDPAIRAKQNDIIKARHSEKTLANTEALVAIINKMNTNQRLPLAMLAFPILRQCPREKLNQFTVTINLLINADENVCLFDYLFTHLLSVQINDLLNPTNVLRDGTNSIIDNATSVSKLLAVMAQVGHKSVEDAKAAYQAGMEVALPSIQISYEPVTAFAAALDPAWPALDDLDMRGKQLLLEGLVATMQHDDCITQDESDLLRATCACLHIPLPMLTNMD